MVTPFFTVKALGLAIGALLFGYAFAIAKSKRYEAVNDAYASAFSTVGLLLILVATGGFVAGWLSLVLEGSGYLVGGVGGTLAFQRITHHKQRFVTA